ncbi:hypothetical protein [Deinococcus sp. AJ005]|uniref:hypothetical protein n=1 Tax=Deinococcus sp. AJ005 TaxID=2652443 RepID=UPI00125CC74D|nr:hypothetical protein [Deinococcus sp. AJ005]QFP77642.1 hypothetical protein DAAJ005_15180 [Deinococcus sp. AJ005]
MSRLLSAGDETGLHELGVSYPSMRCRHVTKATAVPRYGTGKAPTPPRGSGGLSGAYVHWYADPLAVLGYGGLCWAVMIFDKSGYVFTDEPDTGMDEADCAHTHPNGLPVCEVYVVQNGMITVDSQKPVTLKKVGNALEIDGDTFEPMLRLEGIKLSGQYESRSFVGGDVCSMVSGASTFTDTGTSKGNVTGGFSSSSQSASSGTYAVKDYTLILTYSDSHKEQLFAFALPDKNSKPKLICCGWGAVPTL